MTHDRAAWPVARRPVVTVPFGGHLAGREHHVPRQSGRPVPSATRPGLDAPAANGRPLPSATRPGLDAAAANGRLHVVVTSVSSDAHTWNLVYLQLLLEELGCQVANLGACTPDETIVTECVARRPDLIVVSSLNGHGARDGIRLIDAIRSCPALVTTPVVIGGKLDLTGGGDDRIAARLLAAGFDAVFGDSGELVRLRSLVRALAVGVGAPIGAE